MGMPRQFGKLLQERETDTLHGVSHVVYRVVLTSGNSHLPGAVSVLIRGFYFYCVMPPKRS